MQTDDAVDAFVLSVGTAQCITAAIRIARRLGEGKTAVTVACDSGLKYLSTELYSSGRGDSTAGVMRS